MINETAKYIEHLENSRFYEAHEALEHRWRYETDPELKLLLKGLINASVAFEIKRRMVGDYSKPWNAFLKARTKFESLSLKYHFLEEAFKTAEKTALNIGFSIT
jgi:hypothetical protein